MLNVEPTLSSFEGLGCGPPLRKLVGLVGDFWSAHCGQESRGGDSRFLRFSSDPTSCPFADFSYSRFLRLRIPSPSPIYFFRPGQQCKDLFFFRSQQTPLHPKFQLSWAWKKGGSISSSRPAIKGMSLQISGYSEGKKM